MTSRATSSERSAPKLPSRSPEEVEAAFLAANAFPKPQGDPEEGPPGPQGAYENPVVFEAPELLPLRLVNVAWIATRFAIVVWTAAIALVAIRTTRRIDGAASDRSIADVGDDMTIVVLVGVILLAALFGASVWWSRTVAENTRRLRGRWPSLNRATRVWFYPTVWVALAALTFLRINVTSEFDPLPAIAAIVFALTLYSPYSMLHRIFKTLTRVRPEMAIRAAYLLDLAGFGIIWWRLTDWPDPITGTDSGTVDAMAWAAIAASGLLLISAGITANIAHEAAVAQRYRIRVLATRHVQGLALPLVPRKAWGRVRTSIDDAATRGAGPVGEVVRAADLVVGPGGAPSPAVVAARRTVVPARSIEVAARSTSTSIGDPPAERPTSTADGVEVEARRPAARAGETPSPRRRPVPGAAGQVAARRRPGQEPDSGDVTARRRPGAAVVRGGVPPMRRAGANANVAGRQPAAGTPTRGAAAARRLPAPDTAAPRRVPASNAPPGRRRAAQGAAGAAVARRRAAGGVTGDVAARRAPSAGVTRDATARRALAADAAAARRKALAGPTGGAGDRAGGGEPPSSDVVRDPSTDESARPLDPAPALPRRIPPSARVMDADEPPEPTTIVGVLRFLALGAHVVLAATFVWFVVEARSASPSSSGGVLDPNIVDRLDLVRTANVVAFAVTVLLIGAWGSARSMLARRSERLAPPPFVVVAMCVPGTLLALAGLVVDGRVGDGIVFLLAVLAASLGGACALLLLSTMSSDVHDSSNGMRLWAAVIAVVGLGLTIGGYLQSIEPGDSLSTLTLVAVLTSILVGLGVLIGAPASGEVDDVAEDRPRVTVDRD
jgi:hypothetical protein